MKKVYSTSYGTAYCGNAEDLAMVEQLREKKVDLIFTSPPFPLVKEKKYGNRHGDEYIDWLSSIIGDAAQFLAPQGSIVIEIGNAWEKGSPTMSTVPLEALLAIKKRNGLHLCQQFIWHNKAKLPSPVEWVNKKRIRVKDTFTNIWWLSPNPRPKANNKNVLVKYSGSMKKLLKVNSYNPGLRPSEHRIGEVSFLTNNSGAIPSNVLQLSNTSSQKSYTEYCKTNNLEVHPARMPGALAEFFVKLLTDEDDLVLDIFGGSNTTGYVAEKLSRKWIAIEKNLSYLKGSIGRFDGIIP